MLVYNLEVVQVWGETSMHAKDPVVNDRGNGKHVEAQSKVFPDSHAIPPLALVIEAVHSVYRLAFVVSTQKEEVFWELNLVSQQ